MSSNVQSWCWPLRFKTRRLPNTHAVWVIRSHLWCSWFFPLTRCDSHASGVRKARPILSTSHSLCSFSQIVCKLLAAVVSWPYTRPHCVPILVCSSISLIFSMSDKNSLPVGHNTPVNALKLAKRKTLWVHRPASPFYMDWIIPAQPWGRSLNTPWMTFR